MKSVMMKAILIIAYLPYATALFDVRKTNQRTVYNCQTADIIVTVHGDENVVYVASTCIFIAGATSDPKKINLAGFLNLNLEQPQTITLNDLQRGVIYAPTAAPQKGYIIRLIATLDPLDKLPQKISSEYKKQGVTHALQIWRSVSLKSPLVGNQDAPTASFEIWQTLPASTRSEDDTITIYPHGEIILNNNVGTITLPAQGVR